MGHESVVGDQLRIAFEVNFAAPQMNTTCRSALLMSCSAALQTSCSSAPAAPWTAASELSVQLQRFIQPSSCAAATHSAVCDFRAAVPARLLP